MKISVIIPNYNHALYLHERIESVLAQDDEDFEVIILDDCSTDNSRDIIENYRNHPKVSKIIYNKQNSGCTFQQWNMGVTETSGDFIWIAESDDVASKNFLSTARKHIKKNDAVLFFCQSYRIDEDSCITGTWRTQTEDMRSGEIFEQSFTMEGEMFINTFLIYRNVIPNASGVVFKKETYLLAGKVDVDIKYNSDWLCWLKILTLGNIAFCAEPYNYFRFHNKSVISTSGSKELFRKKYDILMRKRLNKFLKNYKGLRIINRKIMREEIKNELNFYYQNGFPLKSLKYFFKFYFG